MSVPVPRLRFPGFDEPWSYDPLSDVLLEHKLKNIDGRDVFSVSMESGIVNQIDHLGRSYAANDTSHYNLGRQYDIVYTKSPLKAFPFGIVKQCKFAGEVALSPLYGVFTPANKHVGYLIEAYFESPSRSHSFLAPLCQKGAKNTIQITNTTFLSGRLRLPRNVTEQQKVADCLSSLDELIVAQTWKVEALKTYKKGLMEQLFPNEGETQPRMRFPEFRDEPNWVQNELGRVAVILKGKGISKADIDPNGSQACIRYGELYTSYGETIREAVSRTKIPASELFLSKADDVIIPSSGESKIDIAKASCVLIAGIALGGDLNVIRSKLNGTFLSYYLNGPKRFDIAKVAQGDTVVHLYPHQLEGLQIATPSQAEQRRIATCLSSIDALITAETHKHEALKRHKRGLVQQLFPSPEQVVA